MKILITGGCGFVGSNLAIFLKKKIKNSKIYSLDNLYRKGASINEKRLKYNKIKNFRINIQNYTNISKLKKFDLIIDCCAEPAIEESIKNPDKVIHTNLIGSYNLLKKCISDNSKIIFLSTSRVYSIKKLYQLYKKKISKFKLSSKYIVDESFDTSSPKSLYGFSKLASEDLIKEYCYTNKLKFIINRFGVISGPWQFGKIDQGFVSLWVERHFNKKKLNYIGFDGKGNQLRDIIHIDDVCEIIHKQILNFSKINNEIFNIGGGLRNTISLKKLTFLCQKLTNNKINVGKIKKTSIFDVPAYITNNGKIYKFYKWRPKKNINIILKDIFLWITSNKKLIKKYF